MKRFAQLFLQLDSTTKTNEKVRFLADYFTEAPDDDKLWTVALLSGKRPKRTVKTSLLREWAAEESNIPLWLFEESYHVVGDLAETISTLVANTKSTTQLSLTQCILKIISLRDETEEIRKETVINLWHSFNVEQCFVFNKLITGGFRVGVSKKLMVRALAKALNTEENALQHRIMGNWTPQTTTFADLLLTENAMDDLSKPYPFYLAYALEDEAESLGNVDEWQIEHKWDGIRGQLIKRNDEIFIWSRGEELITDKFPELVELNDVLPNGVVIDGEILAYKNKSILDFNVLQKRIGRKNITKNTLEKAPVVLRAYDLLEFKGEDLREKSQVERRKLLDNLFENSTHSNLQLSKVIKAQTWNEIALERDKSRQVQSEGLMLKRKNSTYGVGRKKGDWWKWKVDPFTIDGVLLYAMRGHGRRANLYTDYTFAVWNGDDLVPFAKAYSGLTDKEFKEVDRYVKKNTIDRFGPVRSVTPKLVFEIAFEGIAKSTRHKSGIALRFPRMKRWRKDKPVKEANTLADLEQLLANQSI